MTSYDTAPTLTLYTSLQSAFDHMNRELFGGRLEAVLITLQRRAHSRGYFHAEQFSTRGAEQDDTRSEIALNPSTFYDQSDREIAATLAHEMTHLRQFLEGENLPKGRMHNKEWAEMMEEIGLTPTSDGTPDGKRTGPKMTHMIVPGGKFDKSFDALVEAGWKLDWQAALAVAGEKKVDKSKVKFTCGCGQNVWGKEDVKVMCALCGSEFLPAQ